LVPLKETLGQTLLVKVLKFMKFNLSGHFEYEIDSMSSAPASTAQQPAGHALTTPQPIAPLVNDKANIIFTLSNNERSKLWTFSNYWSFWWLNIVCGGRSWLRRNLRKRRWLRRCLRGAKDA
jgi:hypothetical protein